MKLIAIVQARMSSTRLPNKVLLPLNGVPVLEHIHKRLCACKKLEEIIIATSIHHSDNILAEWCKKKNIKFFRGDLNDVLDRYYKVALKYKADSILRVTGDCPLIDPNVINELIKYYYEGDYDTYSLSGEFPDGLDCQIFSFKAIEIAWKNAKLQSEREHVGPYIENNRS